MAKRKPKPKASTTTAPSVVPTAILELVSRLCANREAAKMVVTHALIGTRTKSSLSRLMKNAERVLEAADKDQDVYDLDGALNMGLILSLTTPKPKTTAPKPVPTSKSPHSTVRKSKKPYWIKVVSSYDPSQNNGYGLKGRFIDESDVPKLPSGTIFVVQTSHGKSVNIGLFTKRTGVKATVPFPSARPPLEIEDADVLSNPANYSMLFSTLAGLGIPMTRKPIPF